MTNRIEDFQTIVMRHLLVMLGEHGRSFLTILAESQNCDPAFLMNVLREMEALRLIHVNGEGPLREYRLASHVGAPTHFCRKILGRRRSEDEKDSVRSVLESDYFRGLINAVSNSLPEPSLVYSQWWFTELAYTRLITLILRMISKQTRIAFLGASTLGAVFTHCCDSPATIIDVDEVLLKRVRSSANDSAQLVCRDISEPLDSSLYGQFDIVFADPPWSSSSLSTFLVRSSEMLAAEGTLIISFPPVFTRPSIQTERRELLKTAEQLGLSFTSELMGFTEYRVPSFEYKAYLKHGIELNQPWRQGDVLTFKRRDEVAGAAGISIEPCGKWEQYDYGATRLFLRQNGAAVDGPARIISASGSTDFTYSSTSSRTQLWKHARLVSTRNHVADVSGTKQLASILRGLGGRVPGVSNDFGYSKDVSSDTRAAISMLLGDCGGESSQKGETTCRHQRERRTHAT